MSGKRLWSAMLCVAMLLVASAAAQDEKNEIGGLLGRTFISNQGIQSGPAANTVIAFGKGLTLEGEYARRLWVTPIYSISGEVVAVYNYDIDVNGGAFGSAVVPGDMKSFFVTPAARVNLFPTTAVSPWISFGGGFGRFTQSKTLIYGDANPGKSTTGGVIQGGIGLDVIVWRKLSMRGEVRDFWSGEPDFPLAPTGKTRQHNFFVGGGVFWRF